MQGTNISGNIFADQLTNFLIYEAGFKKSQCEMSVYYKYAQYQSTLVVLSCDCVYCYTNEELGKFFVDTLGKIFHVNFLGYEN